MILLLFAKMERHILVTFLLSLKEDFELGGLGMLVEPPADDDRGIDHDFSAGTDASCTV